MRGLGSTGCVKDEKTKILVKNNEIKERWRSYFF